MRSPSPAPESTRLTPIESRGTALDLPGVTRADERPPSADGGRLRPTPRPGAATAAVIALTALYAVLGLVVLLPEAVYSGDIGVKYVQARALWAHGFTSLDIPYPGEFLDPARQFFPLRPPFVMTASGATQAIFSPVSASLQALAVAAAGYRGIILLSVGAAALVLHAARTLAPVGTAVPVLFALGLGTPLWFYAVSGWEHAPAVALGSAGFACAWRWRARAAPLVAGALVGAGATLRDETILLVPGLLLAAWLRQPHIRSLALVAAGAAAPLAGAAALEVAWFGRPAAAHLRHAVHLLQSAAHLTEAANPELPVLEPMSLLERYEALVEYWLLGYGDDRLIAVWAGALLVALLIRWIWRSPIGLLLWTCGAIGLAGTDLLEVLTAPKWVAGLLRVAPFVAFALVPAAGRDDDGRLRRVVLFTTAAYLALAFAGADTWGGKSLGPRLLLPLVPLLVVSAVSAIVALLRASGGPDRWLGRAGALLAAMAVVLHVFGTVPAYYGRNRDDAAAVRAVAVSRDRIVVADDPFTAQLLFPLYYRKIVFLADSPALGAALGAHLAAQGIRRALLVSRHPGPAIALPPLRLERSERLGRMVVQHWRR